MNKIVNIGLNYLSTIIGKFNQIIHGDFHSETKQERNEASEGKTINVSNENIENHSKKEVQNNSGEQAKGN